MGATHSNLWECLFFAQSVEMLRNITTFHTLASASVERTAGGSADGQKITYNVIKARLGELLYKITSQKFEDPADGEEAIKCGPALGVLSIGMRHLQSGRSNIGAKCALRHAGEYISRFTEQQAQQLWQESQVECW